MTTTRDVELLYELGTLRFIKRSWTHFLTPEFANLAEHSFRVAWIAMIIAKNEGADIGKTAMMALVHDFSESRSCDIHYLGKLFVQRDEEKAVAKSLEGTSVEELKRLWVDVEQGTSFEGKIVKDADSLDAEIELQEQAAKGNPLKDLWKRESKMKFESFHTETAKKLWQLFQETSPHAWHMKENIYSDRK